MENFIGNHAAYSRIMISSLIFSYFLLLFIGLVGGPYTDDEPFDFDLQYYSQSLPSFETSDIGSVAVPICINFNSLSVSESLEGEKQGGATAVSSISTSASLSHIPTAISSISVPQRLQIGQDFGLETGHEVTSAHRDESGCDGYIDIENQFTLKIGSAESTSVPRSRSSLRSNHAPPSTSISAVHVEGLSVRSNYSRGKGNYGSSSSSICNISTCRPYFISWLLLSSSAASAAFREAQEREWNRDKDRGGMEESNHGSSSPSILAMAGWA